MSEVPLYVQLQTDVYVEGRLPLRPAPPLIPQEERDKSVLTTYWFESTIAS